MTRSEHGSVAVRLLGFDAFERSGADEEALELARIVSAATTGVFPAAAIPVEIDVHFMPADARFSLAKRVDWREGRAYALAVFAREDAPSPSSTAAHELYHVLVARWSLRDTPEPARRPGAASSYEEAAAELYAACGELLANGTLPRATPSKDRVTITDPESGKQTFEGALAGDELIAALNRIRDGEGFRGFGPLLAATAFEHMFGEATGIELDSPQGAALLALCRSTSIDPFALEAWLTRTDPAADGATGPARTE